MWLTMEISLLCHLSSVHVSIWIQIVTLDTDNWDRTFLHCWKSKMFRKCDRMKSIRWELKKKIVKIKNQSEIELLTMLELGELKLDLCISLFDIVCCNAPYIHGWIIDLASVPFPSLIPRRSPGFMVSLRGMFFILLHFFGIHKKCRSYMLKHNLSIMTHAADAQRVFAEYVISIRVVAPTQTHIFEMKMCSRQKCHR